MVYKDKLVFPEKIKWITKQLQLSPLTVTLIWKCTAKITMFHHKSDNSATTSSDWQ